MNKIGKFGYLIVCLTIPFFLTACVSKLTSETRPAGMPAEARYVGGIDGGVWASCESTNEVELLCKEYNKRTSRHEYNLRLRGCLNFANKDSTEIYRIDDYNAVFGIKFYRVFPDEYIPAANDTEAKISQEKELSIKSFQESSFEVNCH